MPTSFSPTRPTLVTGATGDVGGAAVDELERLGAPIRVLVRSDEKAAPFRARGIDAALGDLGRRDALERALDGCEQLLLVLPPVEDQLVLDRAAVDAAVAAGVEHVVKVSTADANPDSRIPWARDLARGDAHLRASGLAWTRLQPGSFMKNVLAEAPAIRRGLLPQTSGHGATAWVDAGDVGAVAARVLTDRALRGGPGDAGRSHRLTGTPATSYVQVARLLTEVLGRRVRYVHLPAPLMYLALRAGGLSHWSARGLVAQFLVVRRGDDDVRVTSTAVHDFLGREPTSLRDFIIAHREALGG